MQASIKVSRGVFGVLVAAALGFGATQALAAPRSSAAAERCTWEMNQSCNDSCVRRGYVGGFCRVPPELGVTVCECL